MIRGSFESRLLKLVLLTAGATANAKIAVRDTR